MRTLTLNLQVLKLECHGNHEFLEKASGLGHPKHFLNAIPKELGRAISHITSTSMISLARDRTQTARQWMIRALQLKEEEETYKKKLPDHCSKVLKTKKLLVFDEMIKSSGYADLGIAKEEESEYKSQLRLNLVLILHL